MVWRFLNRVWSPTMDYFNFLMVALLPAPAIRATSLPGLLKYSSSSWLSSTFLNVVSLTSLNEAVHVPPAMYVFGDSIVDGGNTQLYPPYGTDLNTTVPISWTNGKTIADFIASFLGLPLVPASTKISQVGISKTGVNYGVSGCGILNQTNPKNCSFEHQVAQFNLTVATDLTKAFNQTEDLVHHLTSSVFLISFGINDYSLDYLAPSNSDKGVLSRMAPEDFAKLLQNELSRSLKSLYRLGARKFVVKNIWPLGCTPLSVERSGPLAVSCNDTVNQLLLPYSNSLPTMLNDLQSHLTGATFSHSDDFQFVADLMNNPGKYGITNTTGMCYNPFTPNIPMCKDRDQYLYFDYIHPTQAANYIFSLNCFSGTLCTPLNIKDLIGA